MQFAISFKLSACAKTFDAKIKSAFFDIFVEDFNVKKSFKVFMPFFLLSLARFEAGSIPNKFLKPLFLNGINPTPSLLPISIINDVFFLSFS